MKIVLVIPFWNAKTVVVWALESIKRNSKQYDIEFVFVDDCSTDGTYEYIQTYNPKILIRHDKNLGVTRSWNDGLAAALTLNADIIGLLNSDILVCPNWLDPIIREAEKKDNRYFHSRSDIPKADGTFFRDMGGDFNAKVKEIENDSIILANKLKGQTLYGGQGWSIFFRPDQVRLFHPIPETVKIWYNDNWIKTALEAAGHRPDVLLDSCIVHWGGASICNYPGLGEQIDRDKQEWIKIDGPYSGEQPTPAGLDFINRQPIAKEIEHMGVASRHNILFLTAKYFRGVVAVVTTDQLCFDVLNKCHEICPNVEPIDGSMIDEIGKKINTEAPGRSVGANKLGVIYIEDQSKVNSTIRTLSKYFSLEDTVVLMNRCSHAPIPFTSHRNLNQVQVRPTWHNIKLADDLTASILSKHDFPPNKVWSTLT